MKKGRKPKTFLQSPSYPGGPSAMRTFLSEQIKYPAAAKKEKIEGTVRLRIDINYQGKVTAAKVLTGLGHGCDEEAQRVVRLLKFEVPKQRKIRALFHKTMNIHFKYKEEVAPTPKTLEQPTKQQVAPVQQQQLNYTVVSGGSLKGKVVKQKDDSGGKQQQGKSGGGYSYTIEV